jgi:CDP-diacylglycerol---glycerol-3-phosphate 3-phosphatidyltransferase
MASVYNLKPAFQNLLRPLCRGLAGAGVTANQVTIAAAVLSLAEGAAIFLSHGAPWALIALPPVLFVRMALNAIDGMLAREFGQKSRLGAILNELGDVISDAALYLPFAAIPGIAAMLIAVVVALAVTTEMTGVVAIQIGASRRYDGPMGKSDRALWFGVLAVVVAAGVPADTNAVTVYLAIMALAAAATIVNRARSALKETSP